MDNQCDLRRANPSPARPRPSSARVAGSGTEAGMSLCEATGLKIWVSKLKLPTETVRPVTSNVPEFTETWMEKIPSLRKENPIAVRVALANPSEANGLLTPTQTPAPLISGH